jgi:hypothetical protein
LTGISLCNVCSCRNIEGATAAASGLDNLSSWSACARRCGINPRCRAWVWNNLTGDCYPKARPTAPRKYAGSTPDIFGCSPGYPVKSCVDHHPGFPNPPPPPPSDSQSTDTCGSFAGLRWLHFPQNSLQPVHRWTMPYDVILAGFEGDWFDAAMIYRRWALNHSVWAQAGNLTTRSADASYPSWLLQAPLWTQIWSGPLPGKSAWCVDPEENIRLASALGVPIGTHWYVCNPATSAFDSCAHLDQSVQRFDTVWLRSGTAGTTSCSTPTIRCILPSNALRRQLR